MKSCRSPWSSGNPAAPDPQTVGHLHPSEDRSMTRRFIATLLTAAFSCGLVASAAVPLAAQTSTGTVRGYVRNGADRAATGAEVTAKNLASGVARSAVTRADGSYILPGLEPGAYDLSA